MPICALFVSFGFISVFTASHVALNLAKKREVKKNPSEPKKQQNTQKERYNFFLSKSLCHVVSDFADFTD